MPDPLKKEWPLLIVSSVMFCLLWLWQVRESNGFLEADACTHYLISRLAFAEPYRFVDVWGRPLKTLLYAGPAYFLGRLGVQGVSLFLAFTCAFVALLTARDLGVRRPVLAFIFTLGMPLLFLHSFSELTELPFAALLAVSFYFYTRGKTCFAALLTGLLPLARPEGFAFVALFAFGCLLYRNLRPVPYLVIGLALWSYLGWEAYGRDGPASPLLAIATWIPRHWPYAGDSVYTEHATGLQDLQHLVTFPATLPAITGPFVFPGLIVGFFAVGRLTPLQVAGGKADTRPSASTRHLVLLLPLLVLTAHSVLYCLGKMATNGELRYMLVVAPFWAILTAAGWERILHLLRRPPDEGARFGAYASVLPLFLNLYMYRTIPIRFDNAWETTRFVAHWAGQYGPSVHRPAVMAAHPGIYYFLDRTNVDSSNTREFIEKNIKRPPPGTLLLYDPIYARFNAARDRRVESTDDIVKAGWQEHPTMRIGGWRVFLSPGTSPGSGGVKRAGVGR